MIARGCCPRNYGVTNSCLCTGWAGWDRTRFALRCAILCHSVPCHSYQPCPHRGRSPGSLCHRTDSVAQAVATAKEAGVTNPGIDRRGVIPSGADRRQPVGAAPRFSAQNPLGRASAAHERSPREMFSSFPRKRESRVADRPRSFRTRGPRNVPDGGRPPASPPRPACAARAPWVPACAGMTEVARGMMESGAGMTDEGQE